MVHTIFERPGGTADLAAASAPQEVSALVNWPKRKESS
jgi:hypothetical protein